MAIAHLHWSIGNSVMQKKLATIKKPYGVVSGCNKNGSTSLHDGNHYEIKHFGIDFRR